MREGNLLILNLFLRPGGPYVVLQKKKSKYPILDTLFSLSKPHLPKESEKRTRISVLTRDFGTLSGFEETNSS